MINSATKRNSARAPLSGLWIASRSLSSGAHSRDPLARNDELGFSARLSRRPYTSANPAIVTASTTLGDAMDDDEPILGQMTDAVSTAATVTADAAKTVVKKGQEGRQESREKG